MIFFRINRQILPLLILLAGCGVKDSGENVQRSLFRTNLPAGITSLDPAFSSSLDNIKVVRQLYNGLVETDENLTIKPSVAKRWEVYDDGKTYVFYLRNDVYFHESPAFQDKKTRKVTAYDVEYSFFRLLDEKIASPGRWVFRHLYTHPDTLPMGFKAVNDSVFRIHLKYPFPPFLGLLSMTYCSIVPHEAIDYYGSDFRRNPVGTGPFQIKYWEEGVKLILVKNPRYFEKDESGKPLPYVDAVHFNFIKDEDVAFFELVKGELDFISGLHGSIKKTVLTDDGKLKDEYKEKIKFEKKPFLNTEYLGFRLDTKNSSSPIRSVEFRQAVNMAFDRKAMIRYLRQNIGRPADGGIVPPGLSSFDPYVVKGYEYNPQKARELLKQSGYLNQNPPFELVLYTTAQYLDMCEFIQQQLQEIGIKCRIEVNTAGIHAEMVANGKADFFRKSWVADYPDPENYLSLFYSPNFSPKGPNYTHFYDKEFDNLYDRALKEQDPGKRNELYKEMDKIIIAKAPIVPLYYDEMILLSSPNVKNLKVNAMSVPDLKWVRIEQKQ